MPPAVPPLFSADVILLSGWSRGPRSRAANPGLAGVAEATSGYEWTTDSGWPSTCEGYDGAPAVRPGHAAGHPEHPGCKTTKAPLHRFRHCYLAPISHGEAATRGQHVLVRGKPCTSRAFRIGAPRFELGTSSPPD